MRKTLGCHQEEKRRRRLPCIVDIQSGLGGHKPNGGSVRHTGKKGKQQTELTTTEKAKTTEKHEKNQDEEDDKMRTKRQLRKLEDSESIKDLKLQEERNLCIKNQSHGD